MKRILYTIYIVSFLIVPHLMHAQAKNYIYVQRNDSMWVKNTVSGDSVRLYPPDSVVIAKASVQAAQKIDTAAPYMRVSKNVPVALSSSWQTINFSPGATAQDVNLFPNDSTTGKKVVWYDTTLTNRLFKFSNSSNYQITLYLTTTTVGITTRASVQYRLVIPNGVSPGVDFYFPFPNNGGYEDLWEITLLNGTAINSSKTIPLYVASNLKANGMYLQIRLSNGLVALGTCTLNAAAFLLQQTK